MINVTNVMTEGFMKLHGKKKLNELMSDRERNRAYRQIKRIINEDRGDLTKEEVEKLAWAFVELTDDEFGWDWGEGPITIDYLYDTIDAYGYDEDSKKSNEPEDMVATLGRKWTEGADWEDDDLDEEEWEQKKKLKEAVDKERRRMYRDIKKVITGDKNDLTKEEVEKLVTALVDATDDEIGWDWSYGPIDREYVGDTIDAMAATDDPNSYESIIFDLGHKWVESANNYAAEEAAKRKPEIIKVNDIEEIRRYIDFVDTEENIKARAEDIFADKSNFEGIDTSANYEEWSEKVAEKLGLKGKRYLTGYKTPTLWVQDTLNEFKGDPNNFIWPEGTKIFVTPDGKMYEKSSTIIEFDS